MATESHRLSILTSGEIDHLYGLPRFTEEERRLYFGLSATEREAVEAYTPALEAHFTLLLGYFKAKQQFFVYEQESVLKDLRHVLGRLFPGMNLASVKMPSKPTRLAQQQIILELFHFRSCDSAAREELERKAQRVVMLSAQPIFILREMLHHLSNQRIVAPAYKWLQDMVGRVVIGERNRITQLLAQTLTPLVQQRLDRLLHAEGSLYRIDVLRRQPKDFGHKELRREVERRKVFQPLHEFGKAFLAAAGISNDSGKYYASLVRFLHVL